MDLENKLAKVVTENDRLKEEAEQNRVMMSTVDAAVRQKIDTFLI
jgi:hypothetical protein